MPKHAATVGITSKVDAHVFGSRARTGHEPKHTGTIGIATKVYACILGGGTGTRDNLYPRSAITATSPIILSIQIGPNAYKCKYCQQNE